MTILYVYPPQSISVTPSPIQYLKDGTATDVSIDTVTPSNSNPLPVTAQSFPLPTGASTSALQTTGNSSLSSIDGKFTTLNAKDFATSAKQDTAQTTLSALEAKVAGSLAPVKHDQVILTYVGATTDIATVTYKFTGTTVATLTLSYDGSNRLVGVVRS
jgi:hypothetical protein